ncbi:helix-turn-helix domain-containing protein [Mycolicibacillus trivialis]|uniref:XRE family transcriptional regulator n=1 Tax=Mycolicibacillus trivialis TaxID=1798 RepID=A0A1X2EJ37_9MYCO|nr:helix-turn-helix transcriptional regulator [Mycolicibacillus trivialis]ORX03442.1 XRE family transcriptional regulator [Mycolicibacillus trivialis]
MDVAQDIREFLMSRRAKIGPEQVGLTRSGRRRVPGLRREEVAQLAGVSTEYYTKIERGNIAGVSVDVLDAVARALRLNDDETAHFWDLTRAGADTKTGRPKRRNDQKIPDGIQTLMDSMATSPAIVMNGSLDFLAANALGRAIYAPMFARANGAPNLARFLFLDASSDQLFPQWDRTADEAVALLQAEAARAPHSPGVTKVVGELATRCESFRLRLAAHNVTAHKHGSKKFGNARFGELTLTYHVLAITAAPGLSLVGYTAEPNSPAAQAIQMLADEHSTSPPTP